MTWVKICGITNLEDALVAVEAGADALGFVFYEKSPRNVGCEDVGQISAKLPLGIERVGVVAGQPLEDVITIGRRARLTALQFHLSSVAVLSRMVVDQCDIAKFDGIAKFFLALPMPEILKGKVQTGFSLTPPMARPEGYFDTLFIDSGTVKQPGGTGKRFDWTGARPLIAEMKAQFKIVVAGGLTPENVTEAVEILHPWGVDVSSGVEARSGKKDPEKVRAFVKAVREYDKANSRN
jgi:phosphoribosylanthranilate isomerase